MKPRVRLQWPYRLAQENPSKTTWTNESRFLENNICVSILSNQLLLLSKHADSLNFYQIVSALIW